MARIVNIKYKCCGLYFDAAIDCDWDMHGYGASKSENEVAIELYCIDRREWDVHMVYQQGRNDQNNMPYVINHTDVDWENLMKETRKWVKAMRKHNN